MENHFHFQILVLFLHTGLCTGCGPAEYLRGEKCCPMCPPGNRVHAHCTEFTTTQCIPCTGPTYLDQPNGRSSCFPCTTCDPVSGLKLKQGCTSTSDAVCEPLQGYFCKLPINQGCKVAQKHSRCKPGQYISQQATSFKDTECSDCTADTFSTGSWTFCKPHTKCESLDMVQLSPGNHSSDTTCERLKSGVMVDVIIGVIVGVINSVIILIFVKMFPERSISNFLILFSLGSLVPDVLFLPFTMVTFEMRVGWFFSFGFMFFLNILTGYTVSRIIEWWWP
ncbi:tumor necrosis factor receptor superfamily member 14-like [Hypomesus transpacificus]|uniref:tumor necrosis factor receptor superfamily member 14-like n=1 Tax=Hypomesus transpacificus TaxID=137520 RepID=UPI001F07EA99|nr:tumor necrosis factor receptor superfamily member 14-like [Hypomesus transpacificus]